ncbi:hypothetical protein R1flu_028047 [Riccia fluitans]|uniref:Uncharacterized protein n=1 Tax=Riccia fluitans TaxID=41844 RepID=A0ABD1XKJ8_9MARC
MIDPSKRGDRSSRSAITGRGGYRARIKGFASFYRHTDGRDCKAYERFRVLRPGSGAMLSSRSSRGGHEDGPQQEHKPLQEWLESISHRMMNRIDAVGDEVQKLVHECGAVELDLKNAFNSFRCLSSTQFVENRVYDEDETESVRAETPARESQHSFAPTESYEDEILPRYKEAVSTAWATFEEIHRQHDKASRRLRSRNRVLRSLDYDGRLHLVPHIIGTDEFARDINCGLGEIRHKPLVVDGFEVDSDTEREGVDLAAELVGAESLSGGDWSEAESDLGDQGGGFEPAVSAALDFKAMLEAALRNPSLPYDGNSSAQDIGEFGRINNDFFLGNAAVDDYYSSPRTMSRTVESGNNRAGDTSATTDASDSGSSWQLTGHIPGEVAVQSTADYMGASLSLPSQPSRNEPPLRATLDELLKKPFKLNSQNSSKDEVQNSSDSNVQLDYSGLSNLPFIPGGLFDDDEDETASLGSDLAHVHDSNTEPTVPENLFQRRQSVVTSERLDLQSRSSSSVDVNPSKSPSVVSSSTTGRQSPELKENALPMKRETSDPSSSSEKAESVPIRSVTSNAFKELGASKSTAVTQTRGGLFDDSDDDDDAAELFGKSLSRKVTDGAVNSQPALRTWASVSSKGLFDDLEEDDEIDAQKTVAQQPAGTVREGQKSEDPFPLLRQVSSARADEDILPREQSYRKSTSVSLQNHLSQGQKENATTSQSGTTPASRGKSSGSSLSGSSPEALQKQSPCSLGTGNRIQGDFSSSDLSGSSHLDGPKKRLFDYVVSTQNRSLGSSNAEAINLEADAGREKTSEPHVSLESLLAASIRPAARTVVYSSDGSDSWSSSGIDDDGDSETFVGRKAASLKLPQEIETAVTQDFESDYEEDVVPDLENGTKPAALDKKSPSVESRLGVLVPEEELKIDVGLQDVSSSSTPGRPERAEIDIQDMNKQEEQGSRLLSMGQTYQSGVGTSASTDVAAGAERRTQNTMSTPLALTKRIAPSQGQTVISAHSLPVLEPPQQVQPLTRNLSEDATQGSDRSISAVDSGRLRTGGTFTSLFDDDDGEDDLFGTYSPQERRSPFSQKAQEPQSLVISADLRSTKSDDSHEESRSPLGTFQSREQDDYRKLESSVKGKSPLGLFTTRGRDEAGDVASSSKINSPLDPGSDFEQRERSEAKEAPLSAKGPSPVPSRVPTGLKVDGGKQASGSSASKLSSLLFGDDDDDSEDALFGPLREKHSGRNTSSARRTTSSSLFDD